MKKVYSKKLGAEAYALAPEQLDVLRDAGYSVPSPADVIADAGAAVITPPEGARAYVVMNLKTGEFSVRARSCTLRSKTELGEFSGEVVRAGMVKALVERADPDGATLKKQETPDAESSAPATDPPVVPPALTELIKSALRNVMPTIAASLKATNTPASSAPVINLREVDR